MADVRRAEEELHRFMGSRFGSLLPTIKTKKTIDDEIKGQLNAAIKEFVQTFAAAGARGLGWSPEPRSRDPSSTGH